MVGLISRVIFNCGPITALCCRPFQVSRGRTSTESELYQTAETFCALERKYRERFRDEQLAGTKNSWRRVLATRSPSEVGEYAEHGPRHRFAGEAELKCGQP